MMEISRRDFLAGAVLLNVQEDRLAKAIGLIRNATSSGEVSAAALHVRHGSFVFSRGFGSAETPDTVFLIASITKPMTATAIMTLVEQGRLSLDDPARKFLPEFSGDGRELITLRHLLTHTSGLPDMLPENEDLRKRHAPLKDFVAATCKTPLLFKAGTEVRYQSMGILLAAEIAERITRIPFRDFLREAVFAPLGMKRSALGLGGHKIPQTAQCQVTGDDDWNWNSLYWRDLGAPWGGAHSTAPEIAAFLDMFLNPNGRVLKPDTAKSMIVDQTGIPKGSRGIGWMAGSRGFGKGCSPRTFGHSGSTGTIAWADPETGLSCVFLNTRPAEQSRRLISSVCDAVSDSGV